MINANEMKNIFKFLLPLLILLLFQAITLSAQRRMTSGSTTPNYPLYTNEFVAGTTLVIDRPATEQYCNVLANFLTFTQVCNSSSMSGVPYSGYMRLSGLSTINNTTQAILTITADHGTGAVGPWTAAEAKHFGLTIYTTDADNNYLLMISPAASALGQKSIQLAKQVAGVESELDSDTYGGLQYNTEYILELERVAGVLNGRVYDIDGNLLGSVSAADTSLSSGNSGVHGYSVTYTVRQILIF